MKKPIVETYFRKPYISQANHSEKINQIKFKQSFKNEQNISSNQIHISLHCTTLP